MPDWRDEMCGALDFWIAAEGGAAKTARLTCIGRARPSSEPGWYDIDVRGVDVNTDQAEPFRLSGSGGPAAGPSYRVTQAVQEGPLVRVRVAEFVSLADAYLWQHKQPATYLLVKLREGIAGLADAGLANDLAAGRLAPRPEAVRAPAAFDGRQQEAYASCLGTGVRIVWGPPGTGKTWVLSEAISALLAARRRVLLVSATNIAVDNALLNVIRGQGHEPGQMVRVGSPHHRDVLKHPEVCLPDLVRGQLTEVAEKREAIETRLVDMRRADEELASLRDQIAGFDRAAYARAAQLIADRAAIPDLAAAVHSATAAAHSRQEDTESRRAELTTAESRVQRLAGSRSNYAEADRIQQELTDLGAAADDLSVRALTAGHTAQQTEARLNQHHDGAVFARMRSRRQNRRLGTELAAQRQLADDLEHRANEARALLARRQSAAAKRIRALSDTAKHSRADIADADAGLKQAEQACAEAEALMLEAEAELTEKQQALIAAEARPKPTAEQRTLAETAERRQWPALATRTAELHSWLRDVAPERKRLEAEYASLEDQFERLRKDAEGEIIRRAQLVATTLARLRTSSALMDGPYDVVLIDEVGAANLPEIFLAVSRAKRAAVLFGDFLQLGAVLPREVEQAQRPDVQRWVLQNVFEHCGIATSQDAGRHQGCTVLEVQHRFGPEIMRLANAVAYDGLLKPGPNVRPHTEDDPEIVLIDVDGLGEIARVRPVRFNTGWWPAGALLSRVLADFHQARGEGTGVVTPYRPQVDATLEALRDQEPTSASITDVGTVHRFQGRQFPVVVFDLVEDEYQKRWMAKASAGRGKWQLEGVRLFTVAVTRPKTRLYFIGSRRQIATAPAGTPLAQITRLLESRRAKAVAATSLITPTSADGATDLPLLGPFSSELAEILAEHIKVADIHDERSFYQVFADYLGVARHSIWIWSPWAAKRVWQLRHVLADAVGRGVQITLFVRDPSDKTQGQPEQQRCLAELRDLVNVVEVNLMHQKIVVIDDGIVLLGSLNTLSQRRSREVMLVLQGGHFARKMLEHEHAADFAAPPRCGACRGRRVDLRRSTSGPGDWYWRCYNRDCPSRSKAGKAWTQRVTFRR